MQEFREGKTKLLFPNEWSVIKWDDSSAYTNFKRLVPSKAKAVDFICSAPDSNARMIFIEVKDYRTGNQNLIDKLTSGSLKDSIKEKLVLSIAGLHFTERREIRNSNSFDFSVSPQKKLNYVFLCFFNATGTTKQKLLAQSISFQLTRIEKEITQTFGSYNIGFRLYTQAGTPSYAFTFELDS